MSTDENNPLKPQQTVTLVPTPEQQRAMQEFTSACNALVSRFTILNVKAEEKMDKLGQASRRHNRWILVIIACVAVSLLSLSGLALGSLQLHHVQGVQKTVSCNLYQRFIATDTPAARAIAQKTLAPADLAARTKSYAVIRHDYASLGCTPRLNADGSLPAGQ